MNASVLRKLTLRTLLFPFFVASFFIFVSGVLTAQYEQEVPQVRISDGQQGSGGVITLSSRAEPVIQLSSWNATGDAVVTLYKADKEFLLNYLIHDSENKQILSDIDTTSFEQVAQFNENLLSGGTRVALPLDDTGIWYMTVSSGSNTTNNAVIVRSDYGGVVKSMGDAYVVWAQSFQNWRSLSGVSVKTYALTDSAQELSSGATGDDGIIQFPFSARADIALLEKDGQVALLPINLKYFNTGYSYIRFAELEEEYNYYLFTDRPIYKPGDTMYYKAIIRQDSDARYSVPDKTMRVTMYRGWSQEDVVFEKLLPLSEFGALDGSFQFPEELKTGEYTLTVSAVDKEQEGWGTNGRTHVSVEEYRKPDYFIEIETEKNEIFVGEDNTVRVKGSFFSGQPLAGQSVSYKISKHEMRQPTSIESLQWIRESEYLYSYRYGQEDMQGTVQLDANGYTDIVLPTSTKTATGTLEVISIDAEFIDETGNPVQAHKNLLLNPGNISVLRSDSGWEPGKVDTEYTLPLVVMPTQEGAQVAGLQVEAVGERETWVRKFSSSGSSSYYDREVETLSTLSGTTDTEGAFALKFTPEEEGYYTYTVSVTDSESRRVQNTFNVWVSNSSGFWNRGVSSTGVLVSPDKQQYEPGETAQLTIGTDEPDKDVLVVLQRQYVDRFEVVRMSGLSGTVPVPLSDADMPNTFARAYTFGDTSLQSSNTELKVSAEKKHIDVSLTTDRTSYGPGQSVQLQVKTTDRNGTPVPAEVAVWSVDKSLYELASDQRREIFDAFWYERNEYAQEGNSLEHINFYSAEQGGGCFVAGTQVLLADGTTESIENIQAGDFVLTRTSEEDGSLVAREVTDTHTATEEGYLIINGELRVTPNHILWVNDTWKTASQVQVDDRMTDSQGETIFVHSVEWFAQKTDVYNLTVAEKHTYFADGYWVHNQKGSVRSVLRDAAYWNPTVRTDANGVAELTFTLPDNLTTWVISGVAATADTSVGEAKTEVITQKDVVVRPVVPNLLRLGDTAFVSMLLHNHTESDLSFNTVLDYPGATIETAERAGVAISGRGGMEQLFWKVQPTEANRDAKALFSAYVDEEKNDAIEIPLPIVPFGFTQDVSVAGFNTVELSPNLPNDTLAEYSTFELTLSPTMLGTLPTAMRYLLEYPYGCVEQTTSRFVPAVIAQENQTLFATAFEDKDLEDMIAKGISRLESLQNSDGGWGWSYSGASDPFITAYVADYIIAAQQQGAEVPYVVIQDLERYLGEVTSAREDSILRLYVSQQLNETAANITVDVDPELSSDVLAYAIMLNVRAGNTDPETNGANLLLEKVQQQENTAYLPAGKGKWFGSKDASTALGIRALTEAGVEREKILPLARYILEKRTKTHWSNTFATAQVIQALADFANAGGDTTPAFSYTVEVGDRTIAQGIVDTTQPVLEPISLTYADLQQPIRITKEGEGSLYSLLDASVFRSDVHAKQENNGMQITREYKSGKGAAYYPFVGDTVTVSLQVSGIPAGTEYIVIEDTLPAGLIPVNTSLENERTTDEYRYGGQFWRRPDQVKEDGAVFLVSVGAASSKYVSYQARVITEGMFNAPPAVVADMYETGIYGHTSSHAVRVTDEAEKDPSKVLTAYVQQVSNWPFIVWRWLQRNWAIILGATALLAGIGAAIYVQRPDILQKYMLIRRRRSNADETASDLEQEET